MSSEKLTAEEREARNLSRLVLSSIDFRHALSAATFLMEEDRHQPNFGNEIRRRLKCYETAMVVAYARPFSTSRGKAGPFRWSLLSREFSLTDEEQALHDLLLQARNGLYAHSDDAFSDIRPEIWRSHLPGGRTFDFLNILGGEETLFTERQVEDCHRFLWKIRHHIGEAVQRHPRPADIPVREIGWLGANEGEA